jgi:hypothetical protein
MLAVQSAGAPLPIPDLSPHRAAPQATFIEKRCRIQGSALINSATEGMGQSRLGVV